jgi:plasmid stability protein
MSDMPALHVRNVPADVVDALREKARTSGRSLNAELVALLAEAARRHREGGNVTRRLAQIAARGDLTRDDPRPEDLIREDRDNR